MKRLNHVWAIALTSTLLLFTAGCKTLQPHTAAVHMDVLAPDKVAANFGKITEGMSDVQVRELVGYPTDTKMYQTGKAWIPFYFGPDTRRVEYVYAGSGTVTLTRNQYTNSLKVVTATPEK